MSAVSSQLQNFILPASPPPPSRSRPRSWLSRLANAFITARTRQAEREIARLIEAKGGRMTDDLERHIERHFI